MKSLQEILWRRLASGTGTSPWRSVVAGPSLSHPGVLRNVISGVVFLALGAYFWRRGDRRVLEFDCAFVRPLSRILFSRTQDICMQGTSMCSEVHVCAVSFYVVLVLCSYVFGQGIDRFRSRSSDVR